MFKLETTSLEGAVLLRPKGFQDSRGEFIKTFHKEYYKKLGLVFDLKEEFFSISERNVLRGMHFQVPPYDHNKVVYCVQGKVLDIIVDLRRNSKTYGQSCDIELSAQNRLILFIPKGFAHGFLSLEDGTIMVYKSDCVYAPDHDTGIHWNSFGFDWPCRNPVVSKRDDLFQALTEFESPF